MMSDKRLPVKVKVVIIIDGQHTPFLVTLRNADVADRLKTQLHQCLTPTDALQTLLDMLGTGEAYWVIINPKD